MANLKTIIEGCLFADGDWIESKDQDPSGEIRLIQLADIGDGVFIDKSKRFINAETASRLRCTFLEEGDVLIARMPDPLGRACIFPLKGKNKYVTVVDVCIIRVNKTNCDNRYLQYVLNSQGIRNKIESQKTGTTRERITRKKLGELELPLPALPIQQKIAAILDAADELRQKDRALVAKYDELTQALFLDMFGDPVTNPKGWEKSETIKFCTSIVPGRDKPKSFTGNIPWVTTNDLVYLGSTLKSKLDIGLTQNEIETVKAKVIPIGSVIMTCVGDLGVITINSEPMVINQQLHAFICSEKINNVFLMYNLSHQKSYMNKMASSTTVPYMNKTVSNNVPTICPPIDLQIQFAERVRIIKQQKIIAQQSLQKSEELFNSLLQKAFNGELIKETKKEKSLAHADL